jgi:membrane-bound serine protease (ClpP class)
MSDTTAMLMSNVVYLLLVAGFWIVSLAIISPGTGFYELFALLTLGSAGLGLFFVPFNPWAMIPLASGLVLFILAVWFQKREGLFLAGAAILVIVGSIFLFQGREDSAIAVHPILATVVSGLTLWFYWFAIRKVVTAQSSRSSLDPSQVLTRVGEVRTTIDPVGTVQVGSELWSATADHPILAGAYVKVVKLDGLVLNVKQVEDPREAQSGEGDS